MKELGHRICNLLTIKSIVTLIMTVCFFILTMRGTISAELFISVYSVIIGFYYGTQKHKDGSNNKPDIEG